MKTIFNTFWQSTIIDGKSFLNHSEEKLQRIKTLLNFYYFLVFVTSVQIFSPFYQFPEWYTIMESKELFLPVWSVKWISLDNWEVTIQFIFLSFLGFALLGLVLWQKFRWIRIGVSLSLFFYVSLISSFGKVDHYMHVMVLSSFLLIFIPNSGKKKQEVNDYYKVFFGIQTLILLTYFVSGFFKLYGILDQEIQGVPSALSFDSLAYNMSKTTLASETNYFLKDFVLSNKNLLSPILLITGYLAEFLSIYVIFKPNLHRLWGLVLILLHTGILLTVGPDFTMQILMVGIFLMFSPFNPHEFDLMADLKRLFKRRNKNKLKQYTIFYDGNCLMCNGFLEYISKYQLPEPLCIAKLQGEHFQKELANAPDLAQLDAIVISIVDEQNNQKTLIKARGVLWVLSQLSFKYNLLQQLNKLAPFIGDIVYDFVAKNRTVVESDSCPIPPLQIRNKIID